MDPAVLNYLQQQQQNQTQGSNQMPTMGQPMQGAMPQQQAPYNPFDTGISKAISSARESLGMTDKQQEKALRRSMLTFGDNIAQQPKRKGFWNNFGSVGRALSPAIMAHDDAEDAAFTQNNALANQMLAYQAAEQKRQAEADQQAWERQHKEAILGETRRAHDMTNARSNARTSGGDQNGSVEFEGQSFRPLDKIEQRQANKFKTKAGNTLLAVKEINKSWDELEKLTADNTFQPIGGYSSLANPTKDFFGKFAGNKGLQKETAARKDLAAKMGNLTAVLEAVKAGGGKLGQGMYDRLKSNFPDMKHDDYETIKAKMGSINKEMDTYYKAAKLSADLGISIDPNDIDEMENMALQNQNIDIDSGAGDQNFIVMQDQNGQQYSIPRDEVEDAINDGLTPIGQ
jgi:hypothetical protein